MLLIEEALTRQPQTQPRDPWQELPRHHVMPLSSPVPLECQHHVRNLLTATIFAVIFYLRSIPLTYGISLVSAIFLSVFLSDLFVVLQDCQLPSLTMSSDTTAIPDGKKKWADEPFKLLSTPRATLNVSTFSTLRLQAQGVS